MTRREAQTISSKGQAEKSRAYIASPVGILELTAEETGLCGLSFWSGEEEQADPKSFLENADKMEAEKVKDEAQRKRLQILEEAKRQLTEYFAGRRTVFELPLCLKGTEFQKKDWQALLAIPYGETRSYGEIAAQIGCPKGSRAVGMANRNNPIAIIVPCHRVIGADGSLTGYAGKNKALDIKEYLLRLEGALA